MSRLFAASTIPFSTCLIFSGQQKSTCIFMQVLIIKAFESRFLWSQQGLNL